MLLRSTRSTVRVAVLVAVAAAVACAACATGPAAAPRTSLVGQPMPGLTVQDLTTHQPAALSQFRGRVVLLDVWASWCKPCKASLPFYDALARRHADRGLVVVGVSLDQSSELATRFLEASPASFPMFWDHNESVAQALAVAVMPTAFLIDRSGTIRRVHAGFVDDDKVRMEAWVEELLASDGVGAAASSAP